MTTRTHVSRAAKVLDRVAWAHTTGTRRALGFEFGVRVMDPVLGSYLDEVLVHGPHQGTPRHLYSLVDRGPGKARYPLYFDGAHLATLPSPAFAVSYLLWHINQEVVRHTTGLMLFHASAVERDGAALIFPAPMESGKTTLAAGLVRAGFRYLTDEAVAIDPDTLLVQPYPKALSVDSGSWEVLADLRPQVREELLPYVGGQWHVNPDAIRPGAVAPACLPRFVIAPRYVQGVTTTLEPISRAEAISVLAENSFNLPNLGASGFTALGQVVRGCRGYRLIVGDLSEACQLISRALDEDMDKEMA
jgi:hypothetical protein